MGTDSGDAALRELYAATYSRLVAVVGATAQDRAEAEEAVQDALVRLSRARATLAPLLREDTPDHV